MAKAAGYAHCYEFSDLEDFATQAEEVLNQEGPVLVTEPCLTADTSFNMERPSG